MHIGLRSFFTSQQKNNPQNLGISGLESTFHNQKRCINSRFEFMSRVGWLQINMQTTIPTVNFVCTVQCLFFCIPFQWCTVGKWNFKLSCATSSHYRPVVVTIEQRPVHDISSSEKLSIRSLISLSNLRIPIPDTKKEALDGIGIGISGILKKKAINSWKNDIPRISPIN